MDEKTNAMRLLDKQHLAYQARTYPCTGAVSGLEAAQLMGEAPERVFKTLVTVGKTGAHYVFVIPVGAELNLKRAALSAGEKSIEMIKAKELLPLTGYVHGGCSPIGMKKRFPTFLHESARQQEIILFSAGRIGFQLEMRPEELRQIVPFEFADVADEDVE